MANQEHVAILEQGKDSWNNWRRQHQETRPDLSFANLTGANLSFVNLSGAALFDAKLIGEMIESLR